MEEPKAEVVQEENPKASVVGWFQRSNSLRTSGFEDWSFQLIDGVGITFFPKQCGYTEGFLL